MGRVKTELVKRTARKLLREFPEKFTSDFEKNKKVIDELLEIDKKIRNSVAGYLARLKKKEKQTKK